jgi:RimJ/RimL family protein N-acetyltransferase
MEASPTLDPVEIVAGRFQLRPPSVREAADFLAMIDDPTARLWNPVPSVTNLAEAEDWCRHRADWSDGEAATFVVYDATEGKLLGTVSLHHIDRLQESAEIGYNVAPWARGQGVATAAVRSVTGWAFGALDLRRLVIFHATGNEASCRVAAKAGYVLEGELRSSHRYGDGELHDEHLHARLASDAPSY